MPVVLSFQPILIRCKPQKVSYIFIIYHLGPREIMFNFKIG